MASRITEQLVEISSGDGGASRITESFLEASYDAALPRISEAFLEVTMDYAPPAAYQMMEFIQT